MQGALFRHLFIGRPSRIQIKSGGILVLVQMCNYLVLVMASFGTQNIGGGGRWVLYWLDGDNYHIADFLV